MCGSWFLVAALVFSGFVSLLANWFSWSFVPFVWCRSAHCEQVARFARVVALEQE
jgi:hypothetical protein